VTLWDWGYALSILPQLAKAFLLTIELTVGCSVAAGIGGLLLALLRRSAHRPVALLVGLFIEFIRGTPLLVQLYFLYFGLPTAGLRLSPLMVGIIGLSLHYSAYTSEVYRAGIDSIPAGQWDAARALNFGSFQTWRRIILPEVIPLIIPALGSYAILMFKDTPLLSAITVVEVLERAESIAEQTFRYTEPLTIVGLLFLIVSLISARLLRSWERRVVYARQN
jgi:polar amino acid transport system permease protein